MTAAVDAGRALGVLLLLSLGVAAGGAAPALAVTPQPVISQPAAGSWTKSKTPAFSGTSNDEVDPLTVRVYAGETAVGAPVQTFQTLLAPAGGVWQLEDATALEQGTYTAVAEQANSESEAGLSVPVSFKIDTTPPAPTIASPSYGAVLSASRPAFSGLAGVAAGDLPAVTLDVYADGPGGTETLVESLGPLSVEKGAWTSGEEGKQLPDGIYTAVVRQSDQAGNIGSEPLLFVVESRPVVTTEPHVPPAPSPAPSPAAAPSAASPGAGLRWLQPFPVVRIAGAETIAGARISLLSVEAPVGARVTVTCRGSSCPVRSEGVLAGAGSRPSSSGTQVIVFRRFQRPLRAGVTLEIRVSHPGQIGKFVRFVVRRGKLPTRQDSCLDPTSGRPIACPRA
jgi:hypothetical protein